MDDGQQRRLIRDTKQPASRSIYDRSLDSVGRVSESRYRMQEKSEARSRLPRCDSARTRRRGRRRLHPLFLDRKSLARSGDAFVYVADDDEPTERAYR